MVADFFGWVADAMEEAFAAGRQAAPQSEGATISHEAMKGIASLQGNQETLINWQKGMLDSAEKEVGELTTRIAALEAALRERHNHYTTALQSALDANAVFGMPMNVDKRTGFIWAKQIIDALTPTSGGASEVCPNCDTALPEGCGGMFADQPECRRAAASRAAAPVSAELRHGKPNADTPTET